MAQQFVVPKFIQKKSTVIGPFDMKEFGSLLVEGFLLIVLYLLTQNVTLVFGGGALLIGGTIASFFVKIKSLSIFEYIYFSIKYAFFPSKYVWKTEEIEKIYSLVWEEKEEKAEKQKEKKVPKKSERSFLKEATFGVQTGSRFDEPQERFFDTEPGEAPKSQEEEQEFSSQTESNKQDKKSKTKKQNAKRK